MNDWLADKRLLMDLHFLHAEAQRCSKHDNYKSADLASQMSRELLGSAD